MKKILIIAIAVLALFLAGCQGTGQAIKVPGPSNAIDFENGQRIDANTGFSFEDAAAYGFLGLKDKTGPLFTAGRTRGGFGYIQTDTIQVGTHFGDSVMGISGNVIQSAPKNPATPGNPLMIRSDAGVTLSTFNSKNPILLDDNIVASKLAGKGNAYVCVDGAGKLFRSMRPCV